MTNEDPENPLSDIERTVWSVIRYAYLRVVLKGTDVQPFQLSDDEVSNMLDGFSGSMSADMDLLSDCLKAAYNMGSTQAPSEPISDAIVLHGNEDTKK